MNETYTTTSTLANILQATLGVARKIDPAYVDVPENDQEIINDAQAVIGRLLPKLNNVEAGEI